MFLRALFSSFLGGGCRRLGDALGAQPVGNGRGYFDFVVGVIRLARVGMRLGQFNLDRVWFGGHGVPRLAMVVLTVKASGRYVMPLEYAGLGGVASSSGPAASGGRQPIKSGSACSASAPAARRDAEPERISRTSRAAATTSQLCSMTAPLPSGRVSTTR